MVIRALTDWRHWLLAVVVALLVSMVVRVVAESISGHDRTMRALDIRLTTLETRLKDLERSQHPATTRRWTRDDHEAYAARIEAEHALIYQNLGRIKQRLDTHEKGAY